MADNLIRKYKKKLKEIEQLKSKNNLNEAQKEKMMKELEYREELKKLEEDKPKPRKENKSDMDILEEYSYENNKGLWSDYEVNQELKKEKEKRETEILNKKVQIKLQTYLKSFDLFILPSYEDGFAVAVTEAISSNVPVIVSSAVGAVDLFSQKTHSVFV